MRRIFCLLLLIATLAAPLRAEEGERNAVKITFLSWITGSTKISYERALPEWRQSAEVCTSLISAGYDKFDNDPMGFTLRYSHKFFVGNYSPTRPLDGLYVRPEAIYSRYHYTHSTGGRTLAEMCALLATAGYQMSFGRLLVDGWAGAGYAFGTPAETGYHHGFQLLDFMGIKSDKVALSFSVRVGYTF